MLVDSNGMKVKEDKLSREESFVCQKFFTPKWRDVSNFCTQIQCDNKDMVQKIVVHVGTNDFDDSEAIAITGLMEENIELLKQSFPKAELTVCTIIPRRNNNRHEDIKLINDFLQGSKKRWKIDILNLGPITPKYLKDEKHLDNIGLHFLITAMRYAFTGLLPFEGGNKRKRFSNGGGRCGSRYHQHHNRDKRDNGY